MSTKNKTGKILATKASEKTLRYVAEIQDIHRKTAFVDTGDLQISVLLDLAIQELRAKMLSVYLSVTKKQYLGLTDISTTSQQPELPFEQPDPDGVSPFSDALMEHFEQMPDPMHTAANDAPPVPEPKQTEFEQKAGATMQAISNGLNPDKKTKPTRIK